MVMQFGTIQTTIITYISLMMIGYPLHGFFRVMMAWMSLLFSTKELTDILIL